MASTGNQFMDVSKAHNNAFLKVVAQVLSFIFHPLFIPCYFFIWTFLRFPAEYAAASLPDVRFKFITLLVTTVFFPALTVFLLWRLKFISGVHLQNRKERIVPYVACMIFYWWMWYLSRNFNDQALVLKCFYFGIFLATVPALILNSFAKVSMHAIGMSGLATAMLIACFMYRLYYGIDLSLTILFAGLVLSARLYLREHTLPEICLGVTIGILSQIIAYFIMV